MDCGRFVGRTAHVHRHRFDLPATLAQQLEERAYGLTTKALVAFRSSKNETVRNTVTKNIFRSQKRKRPARMLA